MTVTIVITPRTSDYHAHIEGNKTLWECGKTPNEAIGALIRTHGDKLGLVIQFPGDKTVTRL